MVPSCLSCTAGTPIDHSSLQSPNPPRLQFILIVLIHCRCQYYSRVVVLTFLLKFNNYKKKWFPLFKEGCLPPKQHRKCHLQVGSTFWIMESRRIKWHPLVPKATSRKPTWSTISLRIIFKGLPTSKSLRWLSNLLKFKPQNQSLLHRRRNPKAKLKFHRSLTLITLSNKHGSISKSLRGRLESKPKLFQMLNGTWLTLTYPLNLTALTSTHYSAKMSAWTVSFKRRSTNPSEWSRRKFATSTIRVKMRLVSPTSHSQQKLYRSASHHLWCLSITPPWIKR